MTTPLAIPFRIEQHARLRSTQDAMRERLERGENVHGLVVRAGEQTGGRGRRARDWRSGPGGSYQTLAVRDPAPPALQGGGITLAAALGLAEVFGVYGVQLGVKWPNDLYYRGRKLAGVLCEFSRGHLLVGVGVNVNNDVPDSAAALRGWDVEGVHAVVLEGLQRGLELHLGEARLPERFASHDLLLHQTVTLERGGDRLVGVARGVTDDGRLRLELPSGAVEFVPDGHVSRFTLR